MKNIKRIISGLISASMLISGINILAEEPDLVEQLNSSKSAVELSDAISELSASQLAELGIDITEYNRLQYPEFIAEEILLQGFSSNEEFKTIFDAAMESAVSEKNIIATYGAAIRTAETNAEDNTKPGVTFGNQMTNRNAETYFGFDIPNSSEVMDITLSIRYSTSDFTQSQRGAVLSAYSFEQYPSAPKTDSNYKQGSNYNQSTEIYADWVEFIGKSTVVASSNIRKWTILKGANPPIATNTINSEIIEELNEKISRAEDKTKTTPLSIKMGAGDNMYIISALGNTSATGNANNPHLIVKYDNTKIWHDNLHTSVTDGETGVYDLEEISVEYGVEIEDDTWTEDNIKLVNAETNDFVDISVNVNNVITLEEELADETSYILTITNITDSDGNPLKDRRIYFTTAGMYSSLYFETEQELEIDDTVDFRVYGKMSKREVDVTDEAVITSSDDTAVEYSDGKITALDYGYSEITAMIENVDSTELSDCTLVLVPAVKKTYTDEEFEYSKFALDVKFSDGLNETVTDEFGFGGAMLGFSDEYYTLNGEKTDLARSKGEHQAIFVIDENDAVIYFDGIKLGGFEVTDKAFVTSEAVAEANVMRLYDTAPQIKDLKVSGMSEADAVIGETLTATYEVFDAEGDETAVESAWYIAESIDGEYELLSKEDSITLESKYVSKYIKYVIIPENDLAKGETYETTPVRVTLGKTLEKLLTDVQNTDMQTVREVLEANAEVIGIDLTEVNLLTQPDYVYGELANTSFDGIDDIAGKFEAALNKYLVKEIYPVAAAHNCSTQSSEYTEVTNNERQQLYLYTGFLTSSPMKDVYAIRKVQISAYSTGSTGNNAPLDSFYINEPWEYSDMEATSVKLNPATAEKSDTFGDAGKLMPDSTMQTFTLPNVIGNLYEGCALTVKFRNTGNNMLYLNGTKENQRPYFTITYDKTALMQKEAVFDITNGQLEVAHDLDEINIEFLKAVDEALVNKDNITLCKDSDGTAINVTVEKTADNKFKVLIPENSLEPETTYRLEMKNITDTDGNTLNDRIVRFTTETIIKNLSVITKTSFAIGESAGITVNGLTVNGNVKRMGGIEFTSSDSSVASVDADGKITALKRGTSIITASYKNYDNTTVTRKVIVNVYNHTKGDSFEENANAKNIYSYAGIMSLPVDGDVTLYTSEYNNYAEVNYYDTKNADATISFGGKTVAITSSENSMGWHQIVFDNRGDKMKIYIDGELSDEVIFAGDDKMKASGTGIYVDNVNINDISGTVCSVQNVAVRGSVTVGGKLSANYGYVDPDNDEEEGTIIKWYTSSAKDGNYKLVYEGENYQTISVGFVKVGVAPKNIYETGAEVLSPAFEVKKESNITGGGGGGGASGGGSITVIGSSNDSDIIGYNKKGFTDVTENHWAYEAIMEMKDRGIVNGVTENEYNPDGLVTRAQFAAMLVRALGKNEVKYADSFKDIKATDWYAGYVQSAFEEGLINGFDGNFAPNDYITREQMVKMVVSAYQKLNKNFEMGEYDIIFDDMDEAGEWSRLYIQAACSLKIVSGVGDNKFAPKNNATRAQAAVMINNMLKQEVAR